MNIMKKTIIGLVAVAGAATFGGCAATDELGLTNSCIITGMGAELCGEDAKSWCSATSGLRSGSPALGIPADTSSQAVCDGL